MALRATTIWIVVQFGLPMMFFGRVNASSPFTSGTTRGTSGSMRNAELLSIITVPWRVIVAAYSFETEAPAEVKAMSTPEKSESYVNSSITYSFPRNKRVFPAERAEPKRRSPSTGKFCWSSTRRNSVPTAPLAPTIATFILFSSIQTPPRCGRFSSPDPGAHFPGQAR